jgi:toxin ParE1/3/4
MASVLFAQSAQTDLLEIWLFVAEDSMALADRLLDSIESEAKTLALQANMGRPRPELGEALRSWPVSKSYVLYYLPEEHGITVIRVLHQARDSASTLAG